VEGLQWVWVSARFITIESLAHLEDARQTQISIGRRREQVRIVQASSEGPLEPAL
jgi:hypothetical protein